MKFQVLGTHSRKNFYNADHGSRANTAPETASDIILIWITRPIRAAGLSKPRDVRAIIAPMPDLRGAQTPIHFFFFNRFSTKSNPKATIIRANWRQFARYQVDWKGRTQGAFVGNGFNLALQGNLFIGAEAGVEL